MILYTEKWSGIIAREHAAKYYFLKALVKNLPEFESTKLPVMMQYPYPKDETLQSIANFLHTHVGKNYTLDEIAKIFNISTRTLSRKFKDQLGMNYVRFARSIRITHAFEMIAEKKYTMQQIADQVGYSSLPAFSNIFYKIAGIRPSEYAKLIQ